MSGRFGNFPKARRLVHGEGGLFDSFQKEVQKPGWRWGHREGKTTPDPAPGPVQYSEAVGQDLLI